MILARFLVSEHKSFYMIFHTEATVISWALPHPYSSVYLWCFFTESFLIYMTQNFLWLLFPSWLLRKSPGVLTVPLGYHISLWPLHSEMCLYLVQPGHIIYSVPSDIVSVLEITMYWNTPFILLHMWHIVLLFRFSSYKQFIGFMKRMLRYLHLLAFPAQT